MDQDFPRPFDVAVAALVPVDAGSAGEAAAHSDRLTKPRGALGRLELLGAQLAAIAGVSPRPGPSRPPSPSSPPTTAWSPRG